MAERAEVNPHRLWPGGEVCVQCRRRWPCPDATTNGTREFHCRHGHRIARRTPDGMWVLSECWICKADHRAGTPTVKYVPIGPE